MKTFLFLSISLIIAVCSLKSGRAQSHPADTLRKTIPEVIITATRTREDPAAIGRSITLIKSDEIAKLQPDDLAQLLSMQPGISVTGAGENPGMTETIFMRGTNSNHTLIMIDGVRISDPSSVNDALDLTEIPAAGFDQVEIVRGSHSTLFGSSSIGGVINLISAGKQTQGFHTSFSLRSGIFGTGTFENSEDLNLNYSAINGCYLNFNLYNRHVEGLDATADTVTNPAAFKSFDRDDLSLLKPAVKIGFQNEATDVFVAYGITSQKTDFDKTGWKYNNPFGANPMAYYDGDSSKIFTTRNLITYNASHVFSNLFLLSLSGGLTSLSRDVIDDSSKVDGAGTYDHTFLHEKYSGTNSNHDLQATLKFKNIKLIAGTGILQETMTYLTSFYTNSFFGPFELTSNLDSLNLHSDLYHVYTQAEINGRLISQALTDFNLIAGIRYNHHNLFGDAISYEINPSIHVSPDALLYASLSSGFNAPSLYQLYSPESYYTSFITRGNPLLQPEISSSFEIGLKEHLNAIDFSVALYRNVVKHEIEYTYLWDKNTPVDSLGLDFNTDDYRGDTYLNAGTLYSHGAEISFSSAIGKRLSFSGNVNLVTGNLSYDPALIDTSHTGGNHIQLFNNGIFLSSKTESIGLTRRPVTANFFIAWSPVRKFSAELVSRWVGENRDIFYDPNLGPYGALNTVAIKDYVLFDILLRYSFNPHFSAVLKTENFLNTPYTDLRGFTTRRRSFFLTLNGNF